MWIRRQETMAIRPNAAVQQTQNTGTVTGIPRNMEGEPGIPSELLPGDQQALLFPAVSDRTDFPLIRHEICSPKKGI